MRQMAAMQRRFLDIARREQRERRQQQHEEDRDEEDDGFGEDMAADPGEELSEAGPSIPVPLPKVSVSVVCDEQVVFVIQVLYRYWTCLFSKVTKQVLNLLSPGLS